MTASDGDRSPEGSLVEVESTDRWVSNKGKDELLQDLRVYLARLRDNPRSTPDRLRVAAIQLHLGRTQEALIHYEGVLRGYIAEGRIMSSIALCKRILGHYPNLDRIQRILAALYARAPHGATGAPSPVTPIIDPAEQITQTFVVEGRGEREGDISDRNVVVDRVFPVVGSDDRRPTIPYQAPLDPATLMDPPEDRPHRAREPVSSQSSQHPDESPILLTAPKRKAAPPVEPVSEEVVLLTRPKRKS